LLPLSSPSFALLLVGNLLADEYPSAAASATVGKLPPIIPFPSQDLEQERLDLLVLADHLSFDPSLSPHRNLAGTPSAFFPDEPRV
jgi:hypothetical protein